MLPAVSTPSSFSSQTFLFCILKVKTNSARGIWGTTQSFYSPNEGISPHSAHFIWRTSHTPRRTLQTRCWYTVRATDILLNSAMTSASRLGLWFQLFGTVNRLFGSPYFRVLRLRGRCTTYKASSSSSYSNSSAQLRYRRLHFFGIWACPWLWFLQR